MVGGWVTASTQSVVYSTNISKPPDNMYEHTLPNQNQQQTLPQLSVSDRRIHGVYRSGNLNKGAETLQRLIWQWREETAMDAWMGIKNMSSPHPTRAAANEPSGCCIGGNGIPPSSNPAPNLSPHIKEEEEENSTRSTRIQNDTVTIPVHQSHEGKG